MLKGFKDFLMRGNVVDLAVAVVIGSAFTTIVTAFTNGLIKPLINAVGGSDAGKGFGYQIFANNEGTYLDFGGVINAAINFVLIAGVVYFVIVMPVKKVQERRRRGEERGPSEPPEVKLLTEIRDLLRQQAGNGTPSGTPAGDQLDALRTNAEATGGDKHERR